MHPVADKIKMKAFEGRMEVLGLTREVSYLGAVEHEGKVIESSVLSITGLSLDEAWDVLSRLHGPVGVATVASQGTGGTSKTIAVTASQPVLDLTKPASKEVVKKLEAASKPVEPKAPPKPEPAPEPEPDVDDDLGDGPELPPGELDVAFMAKQEKLRPVMEHMISKGFDTPEKIVAACHTYKELVPTIKAVEAKGSFDKRIERSAMIVISGDEKAS